MGNIIFLIIIYYIVVVNYWGVKFEGGIGISIREEEFFFIWIIVENLAWILRY